MNMNNDSWVRKHAPRTLSDLILPADPRFRRLVAEWQKSRRVTLDGYVLYGLPGTGKTSFNKLLLRDMGVNDFAILECRASGENKYTLDNVKDFVCTERGLFGDNGDVCYVVCDEIDQSSDSFIHGLRSISDDIGKAKPIRFLFTTNRIERLQKIEGFLSRFPSFIFDDLPRNDIEAHLKHILHRENAVCSDLTFSQII